VFGSSTFQQDPTAPEPASIALVVGGMLAILTVKLRRSRRV
jgi:hypothetical protein